MARRAALAFGLTVVVVLFLALTARPAHANTFTVTNTTDSGSGSLRQAILGANEEANNPGLDSIKFDIPGNGPHTIAPTSALPDVTAPLTIDGYTQGDGTPSDPSDDATENTLAQGTNAVLKIELNFANAGFKGLTIAANGSTVKGLVINRSGGSGISVGNFNCTKGDNNVIEGNFIGTNSGGNSAGPGNSSGGVSVDCGKGNVIGGTTPAARNLISGNPGNAGITIGSPSWQSQGNRIEGNLIGTSADGTGAVANANGVYISDNAGGNTVGGTTAASRNVISGNTADGIQLAGNTFNATPGDFIRGNFIGTDVTGTAAVPNGENGISISNANNNITLGGTAAGAGNVISANKRNGLAIDSTGNAVQGNLIGLKADGTGSLGNGNPNFNSGSGVVVNASNNTIGGTAAGAGNTIANNVFMGVQLTHNTSEGNAILSNSIFSNRRLGIDLVGSPDVVTTNDTGDTDNFVANRGQNFPVIASASVSGSDATVSGTFNSNANSTFRLEFFANESCNAAVSGFPVEQFFGEGQTLIGSTEVTTDGSGNASFGPLTFPVPSGQSVITATATNTATNNTSEFSECKSATTNAAPTAVDDTRETGEDQPLTVAAPGVLGNDTDPENSALTAIKVSDPTHGTLNGTFNSNGSFTYTPNAGFTGTDTFTYKANDGKSDSNMATVTINVTSDNTPPPAPSTPNLAAASDTGVSSTDNTTRDTTPTFTGTAEAGSTVKIFAGAIEVGSATADGSGSYDITTSALGQGSHDITATATDAAGNTGPASGILEIEIDTTPPGLPGVPSHSLLAPSRLLSSALPGTIPVKLAWNAATDNKGGSGLAGYLLQQSTNGGAFANAGQPSGTSLTRQLAPGASTYRFRVRATDRAGNAGAFKLGPPAFKVRAFQESSAAIVDSGAWATAALNGAYGGSVQHASASGRKVTFSVAAGTKNVALVSTKASNRGKAQVCVDPGTAAQSCRTVDLFSSVTRQRSVVFSEAVDPTTSHKVEVRVLGQKNASSTGTRVDVDAFATTT